MALEGRLADGREAAVLFMVIEKFRDQNAKSVYRRFDERGRLMPDGVNFVDSWVSADLGRCFQVMESQDIALLQRWVAEWSDLAEFEIVPVCSGRDTAAALNDDLLAADQESGSATRREN